MEKNIAAMMREDVRLISVMFEQKQALMDNEFQGYQPPSMGRGIASAKAYDYLTNLDVKVGDTVVVVVAQTKLVTGYVVAVGELGDIPADKPSKFKWVVQKVDLTAYTANEELNANIEQTVAEAYRTNLRRSFAQQILGSCNEETQAKLQHLLTEAKTIGVQK